MSAPAEQWYTSTLLLHHGPRDRAEYDVMRALDSLNTNGGMVHVSLPDLAHAARMHQDTLKPAIRRLERGGLVFVVRPARYVRGDAAGYRINRRLLEIAQREGANVAGCPVDNSDPAVPKGGKIHPLKGGKNRSSRGGKTTPLRSIGLSGLPSGPEKLSTAP